MYFILNKFRDFLSPSLAPTVIEETKATVTKSVSKKVSKKFSFILSREY